MIETFEQLLMLDVPDDIRITCNGRKLWYSKFRKEWCVYSKGTNFEGFSDKSEAIAAFVKAAGIEVSEVRE